MNRILVIGSGGREHALCDAFAKSPTVAKVYVTPGNPGMRDCATVLTFGINDEKRIGDFCLSHHIDLVVVGPEAPLAAGITDALSARGITVFGPTAAAAQLEASKSFAKDMMREHGIPTADYITVNSKAQALAYLSTHPAPIVIKADGLMAGKGVTVALSDAEAIEAIQALYPHEDHRSPVVIEQYLHGEEFSLMCLVHHRTVVALDIARDHKRVYDNDQGPNTGGMGAYSPVPQIPSPLVEEALRTIMIPIANALADRGIPFTGFLYGGLMATSEGVKTIEFNVRFGDPEAEVILPRLVTPLDQAICAVLKDEPIPLQFDPRTALGVVIASRGYPGPIRKGVPLSELHHLPLKVFHMGTELLEDELVSAGGRVACALSFGSTLNEARSQLYTVLNTWENPAFFWRHDIGKACESPMI
jgi:phosphoribosylamine---glycine ligase